MANVLLDLVKFNQAVNYNSLITLLILYLAVFWLAISVWVYLDARKRISSRLLAIILAALNFLLLVPFFIIYLLLRPAEKETFEDFIDGGVNIPIVNFVGKDGTVDLSFELRINPKKLAQQDASEMKVDISFDSQDPNKVEVQPQTNPLVVTNSGEMQQNKENNNRFGRFTENLKSKFRYLKTSIIQEKPLYPEQTTQENVFKGKKKKHKKKK